MIKALSAVTIAAFVAAVITIFPSFTPAVAAGEPHALAKGDRLQVGPINLDCAGQNWPNIDASCLRRADSRAAIQPARLVTAKRI